MASHPSRSKTALPTQPIVIDDDEITSAPPTFHLATSTDLDSDDLSQPFLDIHDLFTQYNRKHFSNAIQNTYVEYSTRMTLCAGTCTFKGPLGGCRIALSEPLLKFRPRADLRSTLLHEMIHAFLFETEGVADRDGADGHGPKFMSHAERINRTEKGKVNITPYHSFKDEVDLYRVHHWTCNLCGMVIKRAMNRAPSPHDTFWPLHEKSCGGAFVKTKEPERKKPVKKKAPKNKVVAIDPSSKDKHKLPAGVMRTFRIDSMLKKKAPSRASNEQVACPSCNIQISKSSLNNHLDTCLTPEIFSQDSEVVYVPPSDEEPEIPAPRHDKDSERQHTHFESNGQSGLTDKNSEQPFQDLKDGKRAKHVRTRSESAVLKDIVPNSDLLMAFAVNPYSVAQQSLSSLVRTASHSTLSPAPKTMSNDIISILKEATRDRNNPYDMQRSARARIRHMYIRDSEVIDRSDEDSEDKSSADVERAFKRIRSKAQTEKDGANLRASEVLQLIGIGPASSSLMSTQVEANDDKDEESTSTRNTQSFKSKRKRQWKTEQSTKGHVEHGTNPVVVDLDDSVKVIDIQKDAIANCPVCDISVPKEKFERHVNQCLDGINEVEAKKQDTFGVTRTQNVENCPVCDKIIPRNQLEDHVNQCLNEADVASLLFSAEQEVNVNASKETQSRKGQKDPQKRAKGANDSLPRCPVCDLAMPRNKFQTHVSQCMLASGLGDMF